MLDFIIFLLLMSPFFSLIIFAKPLARKLHNYNRKTEIKHQYYKGMLDGRAYNDAIDDLRRGGEL